MKTLLLSLGLAGLFSLSGCYTVPETGRTSLIIPVMDDVAQGASAFAEIKAKEKISTDARANERVRRVGQRIASVVGDALPGAQWEFVVFDAPQTVNAFALPGGKVGVYTGLLALAETDDELAIVMGHEIGHVTARHGAERMSTGLIATGLGIALDASTRNKNNHDLIVASYGLAAGGGMLAFSRSHESEADNIGIRYAAKAGYDPRAAVTFWQKMAAKNTGRRPFEFLSTHPSDARRIADLEQLMPQVLPLYEAAKARAPR